VQGYSGSDRENETQTTATNVFILRRIRWPGKSNAQQVNLSKRGTSP